MERAHVPSEVLRFVAGMRTIHIDSTVAAFTLLASLVAGILCAAPSVLITLRKSGAADLIETLKEGGRSASVGRARSRMRSALVTAEVALSFVLLVGAGLMVETFERMLTSNPGYNPKNLLSMTIALPASESRAAAQVGHIIAGLFSTRSLPESGQRTPAQITDYQDRVLAALITLPGARSAAASAYLGAAAGFYVEGRPESEPGDAHPWVSAVSGRYFETMELPMRQGRAISPQDGADSPPVVVLSETVASHYWPGYPRSESPVGHRVKLGGSQAPWLTVVGVAGDRKNWFYGFADPYVYVPYPQAPSPVMSVLLRTTADPLPLANSARAMVRSVDRDPLIYDVESMEQKIAWETSGVGGAAYSMKRYAAIALLLALTGIYAVTAYTVAQRTHEIGVRMALGARQADVLKMIVGRSFRMAGAGLALGLPLAYVLAKAASSVLYNVIAVDFRAFADFTAVLASAALLAAYLPARRAAKVDPAVALHEE
jgi:putative ABC transport system permease protein